MLGLRTTLVALLALGATFRDDFDDDVRGPLWTSFETSTLVSERNQRLEIRTGAGSGYAGYLTVERYDLRSGYVRVEVVDPGAPTIGWQLGFGIDSDGGPDVQWLVEGDGAQVYSAESGRLADVPLSSGVRWVQVRESGGTTYWEYSPDGAAWTVLLAHPNPLRFDALRVSLQGGNYRTVSPAHAGAFDNFELFESDGGGGDGGNEGLPRLGVGCGCSGGAADVVFAPLLLLVSALRRGRVRRPR